LEVLTGGIVFAAALVIFRLSTLLTANIVLLVIGPVILILLAVVNHVSGLQNQPGLENRDGRGGDGVWGRAWGDFRRMEWVKSVWRWARFWLALLVMVVMEVLLVVGYVKLNPFVRSSFPQHNDYWLISTAGGVFA
jgi:hypothetical protein